MIVEDQSAVVEFLSRPETYGIEGQVDRIETHIAIVFLAGDRAYKLKRAIKLPYLDYSSAARRLDMCKAEVELNRRTAPEYYLGVMPIARRGQALELGGIGNPVDWVVAMRRFDQADLFDHLAKAGRLDTRIMRRLAEIIAEFHHHLEPRHDHGGFAEARHVIAGIAESFNEVAAELPRDGFHGVVESLRAEAEARTDLLNRRRTGGFVRHCHGDLHLRNICLIADQPMLFDAIEFNDEIAVIDTFYDLGFLIMDLIHRDLPAFSNIVLNGYLGSARDYSGLPLLPLYLAMRAAIRALVMATTAKSRSESDRRNADREEAAAYLDLSRSLLTPAPSIAIAIGGLSGSGKSTLAYALAPQVGRRPGAVVLRSDEIRKEIMGVELSTRLDPSGYRPEVSERVYSILRERASAVLASGQSVICDAVYDRVDSRQSIEEAARGCGAPFFGIWLDAPLETMSHRVDRRHGDASDATAAVVRQQFQSDRGHIDWLRLDSDKTRAALLADARRRLAAAGHVSPA
ncbi:MAG: AAA family ATPase [Alphaproteobacteria bacterium]|nr:AAA family ATPase [Alphaproteobacteria bacterium]